MDTLMGHLEGHDEDTLISYNDMSSMHWPSN